MSNTNTGGPAFPEIRIHGGDNYNAPTKVYYGGMTLRDYFAAKAMQGLMLNIGEWPEEAIAEAAYRQAEAMLKAREA
jgi:hypothetical protein